MGTDHEGRTKKSMWKMVEERLQKAGVDLEALGVDLEAVLGEDDEGKRPKVKVVCVHPDLGTSVRDMGSAPRENVVMVRVDDDSLSKLDAWVETGAVKSRSEAAALFIREGLQVRGDELAELEDALKKVEQAKRKLREKAKTVFGRSESEEAK